MILAGDVSPIDVISHIPVLCEENQIPYCYVPSKTVSISVLQKGHGCKKAYKWSERAISAIEMKLSRNGVLGKRTTTIKDPCNGTSAGAIHSLYIS